MTKKLEYLVELHGWSANGLHIQPTKIHRSELIDIIKKEGVKSVKMVIEYEEPKSIQMTESEFQDIIRIVGTYSDPVSELSSRLTNKRYHAKESE